QGLRQGVPAQPAAGAALRELRGGGGVLARGPGRMGLMRRLPALTPGLTLALGTALGLAACSDCGATPAPRRNQGSQGSSPEGAAAEAPVSPGPVPEGAALPTGAATDQEAAPAAAELALEGEPWLQGPLA